MEPERGREIGEAQAVAAELVREDERCCLQQRPSGEDRHAELLRQQVARHRPADRVVVEADLREAVVRVRMVVPDLHHGRAGRLRFGQVEAHGRLHQRVEAAPVLVGAGLSEAGDGAVDETGVDGTQ